MPYHMASIRRPRPTNDVYAARFSRRFDAVYIFRLRDIDAMSHSLISPVLPRRRLYRRTLNTTIRAICASKSASFLAAPRVGQLLVYSSPQVSSSVCRHSPQQIIIDRRAARRLSLPSRLTPPRCKLIEGALAGCKMRCVDDDGAPMRFRATLLASMPPASEFRQLPSLPWLIDAAPAAYHRSHQYYRARAFRAAPRDTRVAAATEYRQCRTRQSVLLCR